MQQSLIKFREEKKSRVERRGCKDVLFCGKKRWVRWLSGKIAAVCDATCVFLFETTTYLDCGGHSRELIIDFAGAHHETAARLLFEGEGKGRRKKRVEDCE